jgi:hypothetical protein
MNAECWSIFSTAETGAVSVGLSDRNPVHAGIAIAKDERTEAFAGPFSILLMAVDYILHPDIGPAEFFLAWKVVERACAGCAPSASHPTGRP